MIKQLSSKQKACYFVILVITLGLGFSLIPGINSFAYMLTPMLAALIMMFILTNDGYSRKGWKQLGLHKLGFNKWLFAVLIPLIPLSLSYGIVWLAGFSTIVIPDRILGLTWTAFPIAIVIIFISNVLTNSLGEELGWRGYLFPQLNAAIGFKRSSLLTGFVHGVWHFPMILFTTQYHHEGSLWIILIMMVLSTTVLGPVIGYVRLKSGSVWPASILHTSHNLSWAILAAISQSHSPAAACISGDISIVVIIFYGLMSLWILKTLLKE